MKCYLQAQAVNSMPVPACDNIRNIVDPCEGVLHLINFLIRRQFTDHQQFSPSYTGRIYKLHYNQIKPGGYNCVIEQF